MVQAHNQTEDQTITKNLIAPIIIKAANQEKGLMGQSKIDKTLRDRISTTIGIIATIEVRAKTIDRPIKAAVRSPAEQVKTSRAKEEKAEKAILSE